MPLEVVCEWGQGHGGDVGVAVEQAYATADMGAHISKYQIFDPARLASKEARRYWATSLGGNVSQLRTFTGNGTLTAGEWERVADACTAAGVEFCATPFDLQAVDLLVRLNVRTFKIASGDITFRQLIEKVAATGKRCLLSTGASTLREIEQAINWFEPQTPPPDLKRRDWAPHSNLVLLACDLQYPTDHPDLGKIRWLADYGRRVGYSDHTTSLMTGMLAARAGARVLEKHCTLNPGGKVPDDNMALTVEQMTTYIRHAHEGHHDGDDLVLLGEHEHAARIQARRSIYTSRPVRAGDVIQTDAVVFLRPCPVGALQPQDADLIIGRRAACDIPAGERITLKHTAQHAPKLRFAA